MNYSILLVSVDPNSGGESILRCGLRPPKPHLRMLRPLKTDTFWIYWVLLLFSLLGCSYPASGGIFYRAPTPEEHCDIDPALLGAGYTGEKEKEKEVLLWATAERQYCWRAYAPLLAAHRQPELSLAVRVRNLEINEGPLADQLIELAVQGEAPDMAFLFQDQAVRLGEAGHLHPLEQCRQRPEFAPIPNGFWTGFSADGRAWGVPMEAEIMHLYYNKTMLAQLGWSDAEISALPARIADGDFILDDLLATAREAVHEGVVEPGLAFVPNRGQRHTVESLYVHAGGHFVNSNGLPVIARAPLAEAYTFLAALHRHALLDPTLAAPAFGDWGNKLLLRDAATQDRLLFWQAYTTEMPRLMMDYEGAKSSITSAQGNTEPHRGDTEIHRENQEKKLCESLFSGSVNLCETSSPLTNRIGAALLPASTKGKPGYAALINSGQFVIFAEAATGRKNQESACKLLAATHASGLLQRHTEKSGHVTFSHNEELYLPSWFPSQVDLQTLLWTPPPQPSIQAYHSVLVEAGVAVERGELTSSAAADLAIERLRDILGSQLVVE